MSDEEKDRPEDAAPEEECDGGTDEKRENDTAPVRGDGGKDGGGKKDNGSDEAARKFVMAFGYIIWILFFIPLIIYKDDAEAKRRANEQLNMLIVGVVGNVLFGIFAGVFVGSVAGMIFTVAVALFDVAMLVLAVMGIVYTVTEKDTPLPIMGAFSLIK